MLFPCRYFVPVFSSSDVKYAKGETQNGKGFHLYAEIGSKKGKRCALTTTLRIQTEFHSKLKDKILSLMSLRFYYFAATVKLGFHSRWQDFLFICKHHLFPGHHLGDLFLLSALSWTLWVYKEICAWHHIQNYWRSRSWTRSTGMIWITFVIFCMFATYLQT